MDKIVTDMNARERTRFIETLELLAKTADDLIAALKEEDDSKLVAPALMFTMTFSQLRDLFEVLAAAQIVNTGDLDKGVPPGFHPDDPE